MRNAKTAIEILVLAGVLGLAAWLAWPAKVMAHCDTMRGPVVTEAKVALEKGDVTPVLKWVPKEKEAEIQAAFAKAIVVRDKGPEARELADHYFLETLVRIHRASEGAPYNGLKDEPIAPIVLMSDSALADGSADELIKNLSSHMADAIREKLKRAVEAKKSKGKSVDAGREFVEAYVSYTHFVEGIHGAIISTGAHHPEQGSTGHKD